MKFTFTDKTSYLAWRQEWRVAYAKLTADIRTAKRGRKMYLRTYKYHTGTDFTIKELVSSVSNPDHSTFDQYALNTLRLTASFQMDRLKEAKELSYKLKQAVLKSTAA